MIFRAASNPSVLVVEFCAGFELSPRGKPSFLWRLLCATNIINTIPISSIIKALHEQNLPALAEMCANVARNHAADWRQSNTAYSLRIEWVRLELDHSLAGSKTEAEESLKKRMLEFLAGVPNWMFINPCI
jgi:hypothetical protein